MTWFANIKMLLCRFIDKKDQRAAGNRLHGQPVRICGWQSRQRRELILSTDPLPQVVGYSAARVCAATIHACPSGGLRPETVPYPKKRPHGRSTGFCPPPRRNWFRRV